MARSSSEVLKSSLGNDVISALDDVSITEIMINPDGCIWIEEGGVLRNTGSTIEEPKRWKIARLLASSASQNINVTAPTSRGALPLSGYGGRFEAIIPPVTTSPTITIRKHSAKTFELDDYVQKGTMLHDHLLAIKEGLTTRRNFLVVGGTGSGKTTLARSMLSFLATLKLRVIVIEDTRELFVPGENFVFMQSTKVSPTSDLVKSSLRMRPDSIVVGEARSGSDALETLKAWNTGHGPGIATVHANSASSALLRLENLISSVSRSSQRSTISSSVDFIIHIERQRETRKVTDILRVVGLDDQQNYVLENCI